MDGYEETPEQKRRCAGAIAFLVLGAAVLTFWIAKDGLARQEVYASHVTKCSTAPLAEYQLCLNREADFYAVQHGYDMNRRTIPR